MSQSGDHASAIVVGAGVFGAAAASELSSRGWRVTLIERYSPANARSSSGDASRLLRFGHTGDPQMVEWYTRSAWRARTLWRELSDEDGRELLVQTGAVWLAAESGGPEDVAERTMHMVGPSCERLTAAELGSLFPDVQVDDIAYGLFESQAGVLRASDCVHALARKALRHGTQLVRGTAQPAGRAVVVDQQELSADRVIWACGAWLGKLFPESVPVTATRQMALYWDVDPEWRDGPAWIDERAEIYGLPDTDGLGLKAQTETGRRRVELDEPREPDAAAVATTRRYLASRFPSLASVGLLRAQVMHYEMTPDANFVIGPLPGQDGVWIMGGGSGHGFKHGPCLGAYISDAIEGSAPLKPELDLGDQRWHAAPSAVTGHIP